MNTTRLNTSFSAASQPEAKQMYADQLQDSRWRKLRERILERDGNCCRCCGASESLEIHHRQYRVLSDTGEWFKPWEYPEHILVTLCNTCHATGHATYSIPVIQC